MFIDMCPETSGHFAMDMDLDMGMNMDMLNEKLLGSMKKFLILA